MEIRRRRHGDNVAWQRTGEGKPSDAGIEREPGKEPAAEAGGRDQAVAQANNLAAEPLPDAGLGRVVADLSREHLHEPALFLQFNREAFEQKTRWGDAFAEEEVDEPDAWCSARINPAAHIRLRWMLHDER